MAKEAIEAVLAAEKAAREITEEARLEATEINKQAVAAVNRIAGESRRAILEREQQLKKEAEAAGLEAGQPTLRRAEAEAATYEALTNKELEPLAQALVERVVGYGNR